MTALYWEFVARHRDRLEANHRARKAVRALERMDPARVAALHERALKAARELDEPSGPVQGPLTSGR